jgi:hypothetical protein
MRSYYRHYFDFPEGGSGCVMTEGPEFPKNLSDCGCILTRTDHHELPYTPAKSHKSEDRVLMVLVVTVVLSLSAVMIASMFRLSCN